MKTHFKFYLITAFLCAFSFLAYSQQYNVLNGKVEDFATRKPLSFASVALKNYTISNVTNADGVFSLKIPADVALTDTLVISYLGYKNGYVKVGELLAKKPKTIKLQQEAINIRSITIRPNNAYELFKSAFSPSVIRSNYPSKVCGLAGFYREIIKKGNQYMALNEAIIDISKTSYLSIANDNVAIYKARGNTNKNASDTIFMQLQGGPLTALQLDIVKDPFIGADVITSESAYIFEFGPTMSMGDNNIYTIDFKQNPAYNDMLFRGRIYLESQTLAVVKIDFEMNVENNPEAWRYFVKRKPNDINIKVEKAKYEINYKQNKNLWYFDYSRVELKFAAKYKGKLLKNRYTIISELAVTDIDNPSGLKIQSQNRFRFKDIMQKKVNDFTDDNFWENYNVIEPDESIENIINKIIRQLKRHKDNNN